MNGPRSLPAAPLPHSEESERAVLAAVLLSPPTLATVTASLAEDAFYVERHRLVYRAMLELSEAGSELDLRTLQDRLQQAGSFERVGGLAFLAGLDLDLPDLGRVDTYVSIVLERALRRRFLTGVGALMRDCYDGSGVDAYEVLRRAEELLLELGGAAGHRGPVQLGDLALETLADLEDRCGSGLLGVSSGFPDWDRLSEGLVPGNLIVLAGRPGMGKTSLALDVARHVAFREALPVALFSLEMSGKEVTQRFLSSESGLSHSDLRASRLAEREWARLQSLVRRIHAVPLLVDDKASTSVLEIASKARVQKAKGGLALLVVDYLQLLEGPSGRRDENRQQEVTALSRAFKVLARELEVPVLLLSQLSRKPEERKGNHRPVLADLRESGAIEQDADMVCFVYREELYSRDDPDARGLAELIVEKNRNGPTGTVDLTFLSERASFRSRA